MTSEASMNMVDKDAYALLIKSDLGAALADARDGSFAVEWIANPGQNQLSDALERLLPPPDCRTADAGCSGKYRPLRAHFVKTGQS